MYVYFGDGHFPINWIKISICFLWFFQVHWIYTLVTIVTDNDHLAI